MRRVLGLAAVLALGTACSDQPPGAAIPSASAIPPSSQTDPPTTAAPSPSAGTSPSPEPTTSGPTAGPSVTLAPEEAVLYLSGPFGTLDGSPTDDGGWPEAAELRTLDQLVEEAPLVVGFRDSDLEFAGWTLSIARAESPSDRSAETLGTGPAPGERTDLVTIDGPTAGDWILRAEATLSAGPGAAHHWRLVVPDQPLPGDGIIELSPPELLVSTVDAELTADLGSSCYVYTCGDVPTPPASRLPVLEPTRGADLELALSDGSGIVGWSVAAWPARDRDGDSAEQLDAGEAADGAASVSIAAPRKGDWVLAVNVVFNLERGSATYYLRVTVR